MTNRTKESALLCKKETEDEKHLVSCQVYQEKRKSMFECLYKDSKSQSNCENVDRIYIFATVNPPPPPPVVMLSYRK